MITVLTFEEMKTKQIVKWFKIKFLNKLVLNSSKLKCLVYIFLSENKHNN